LDFRFVKGEQTMGACSAHSAFELLPSAAVSTTTPGEFPFRPAMNTLLRRCVKSVKQKFGAALKKKLDGAPASP
jgi:hypothetical protein